MKTRLAVVSLVLLVLVLATLPGLFRGRGREILSRSAGSGRRGAIVDRNGEVLAEDRQNSKVKSQKSEGRSQKLEPEDTKNRSQKADARSQRLEPESQEKLTDPKKSKGKGQNSKPNGQVQRIYPLAETAACVIGFVSAGEGRKGAAGLELGMDSILQQGRKGGRKHGEVRLTIDADVQRDFFKTLQRYVAATRAAHGSAVVIASATGEILALAEYPGPDPAKTRIYPPEVWQSRAVTEAFSAEAGTRWPANENWRQTAEALGLGRALGIGLPDETTGMLSESASTTRVSLLQLVRAFSILAEDGRLNRPHLLATRPARRKALVEQGQVIPCAEARELLAQLVAAPPVVPDTALAKAAESVIAHVDVFTSEGRKYVIGTFLDQPFAGHYTLETARKLVSELEPCINHR